MKTEPVLISLEYLEKHRTKKGGYNKRQIESLGLTWPVEHGWREKLVGTILSAEKASQFEQAKYRTRKPKQKANINAEMAISYLVKNAYRLNHKQIVRLREVEKEFFRYINRLNKP